MGLGRVTTGPYEDTAQLIRERDIQLPQGERHPFLELKVPLDRGVFFCTIPQCVYRFGTALHGGHCRSDERSITLWGARHRP